MAKNAYYRWKYERSEYNFFVTNLYCVRLIQNTYSNVSVKLWKEYPRKKKKGERGGLVKNTNKSKRRPNCWLFFNLAQFIQRIFCSLLSLLAFYQRQQAQKKKLNKSENLLNLFKKKSKENLSNAQPFLLVNQNIDAVVNSQYSIRTGYLRAWIDYVVYILIKSIKY